MISVSNMVRKPSHSMVVASCNRSGLTATHKCDFVTIVYSIYTCAGNGGGGGNRGDHHQPGTRGHIPAFLPEAGKLLASVPGFPTEESGNEARLYPTR